MLNKIKDLLATRGITLAAPLSLADCHITKPYLLERAGIGRGTAVLFAVPYYTTECDLPASNISAYAVSRDYHLFLKKLFDEILPILQAQFPQNRFAGFTDHSPIAEAEAAVRAGLGYWGCNHLFLTDKHSSFVFLGEIVTDAVLDAPAKEEKQCAACGACRAACPVGLDIARGHSALTQKKGELTEAEQAAIVSHGSVWGCDLCQTACPHVRRAIDAGTAFSPIPYFSEQALPCLSVERLDAMTDEKFSSRAYAWRGRNTIRRNLILMTEKGEPKC